MFHSSSVLIKHLTSIIKHLHIIPIFRRSERKPNFRKRNIWLFWFMFIKKNMWQWLPMSNHLVCVLGGDVWLMIAEWGDVLNVTEYARANILLVKYCIWR